MCVVSLTYAFWAWYLNKYNAYLPTYSVYIKRKICKENYSYEDTPLIKIIHLNKAP